jgi:hypothetical protein
MEKYFWFSWLGFIPLTCAYDVLSPDLSDFEFVFLRRRLEFSDFQVCASRAMPDFSWFSSGSDFSFAVFIVRAWALSSPEVFTVPTKICRLWALVSALVGKSSHLGCTTGFAPQIRHPGCSIPAREQAAAACHFCVDYVLSVGGRAVPCLVEAEFFLCCPCCVRSLRSILAVRALPVGSVFTRRAAPTFPSTFHRHVRGIVVLPILDLLASCCASALLQGF